MINQVRTPVELRSIPDLPNVTDDVVLLSSGNATTGKLSLTRLRSFLTIPSIIETINDLVASKLGFTISLGESNIHSPVGNLNIIFSENKYLCIKEAGTPFFSVSKLGIQFGNNGPKDYFGSGSPEGVLSAIRGSTFRRTDGGTNTSFYIKESGSGNTGWVAK